MNIKISQFRAIDNLSLCNNFMEGHVDVLKSFGLSQVTSANNEWFSNPGVHVIIAESVETGKIVGGARIHRYDGNQILPLEEALISIDENIQPLIKHYEQFKTGELCGLWISREVAGIGVGFILIKCAMSIISQIKLSSVFALCSPWTLDMFKSAGFIQEKSIGYNGTFYYPKEDLIATAVILKDPINLEDADIEIRKAIFNLRTEVKYTEVLVTKAMTVSIQYNLLNNNFDFYE